MLIANHKAFYSERMRNQYSTPRDNFIPPICVHRNPSLGISCIAESFSHPRVRWSQHVLVDEAAVRPCPDLSCSGWTQPYFSHHVKSPKVRFSEAWQSHWSYRKLALNSGAALIAAADLTSPGTSATLVSIILETQPQTSVLHNQRVQKVSILITRDFIINQIPKRTLPNLLTHK